MIRIEKGTFLYQKQKTSDQNTTKLSFVFSTHITFGLFGQCLIIRKGEHYQLFIVNFWYNGQKCCFFWVHSF